MERPKPTKKLIMELCGEDPRLISSLHHGLYENPMYGIYPLINLDDLIVFSAASWNLRKKYGRQLEGLFLKARLYDIFQEVYNSTSNPDNLKGFVWLGINRSISKKNNELYSKLNPFHKKDLKLRLEKVNSVADSRFRVNLMAKVNDYLFERNYTEKIRAYQDPRMILMNFQSYYSKKGRNEKRYAKEITENLLSRYPTEYSLDYEQQISLF